MGTQIIASTHSTFGHAITTAILLVPVVCVVSSDDAAPTVALPNPDVTFHTAPKPIPAGAVTQDWPRLLGATNNAVSTETKLLGKWPEAGPTLVWEMKTGEGFALPSVAGDRLVYFHRVGDEEIVECLRYDTGERYWRHAYPTAYRDRYGMNNGPRAGPVIDGDRVYTHGAAGMLHCLDLRTGSVVWKRDTSAEFKASQEHFGVGSAPLVEGNLLIVNIGAPGGPCVVAFDKRDGKIVWRAGDQWRASYASPVSAVVHGERRVFVFAGGDSSPPVGGLLGIDPATGHIALRFPWRSKTYASVNAASPIVIGNRVFITAAYDTGDALLDILPDGGCKPVYRTDHISAEWTTPVYRDGYLYGVSSDSRGDHAIVCVEWETGKLLWRKVIEWDETVRKNDKDETMEFTPQRAGLIWADGAFLCLGEMGHLLRLDLSPAGCKVLDRAWLFAARETFGLPVLSRGLLFISQNAKDFLNQNPPRLLCYDLRGGS